jgi:hypothetical protein
MIIDEDVQTVPSAKPIPPPHYYGDTVRKLFIISGILMLTTMAYFASLIKIPIILSVIAIVVLVLLSGLESPNNKKIVIINTVVSALGCVFFQYRAVHYYLVNTTSMTIDWAFFVANQLLALIFFAALYYSSKTVRSWKEIESKK